MSIVGNDNAALEVEIINSNDNVKSANVSVLIWDKVTKDHIYNNRCNINEYRLVYFEPITFRFNKIDPLPNFWFFTNRHTKRHKHNNDEFILDANYSL